MSSFLQVANLVGGVLFALTSIIVGVRLLWLARRTGELPELLIGLAFAVAGCIGYFLGIVQVFIELPETLERARPYASRALIAIGSVLIAVAIWKLFYVGKGWAPLSVLTLAVLLIFDVFPIDLGSSEPNFYFRRATQVLLLVPYVWMSLASLRFRKNLLRRWKIGLGDADPLLARRLRLWSYGTGAIAGLFLTVQLVAFVHHYSETRLPEELFVAIWGIACAACMWLAFFGKAPAASEA